MVTETYEVTGGKAVIDKDPNAVLDYTINWTDWMPQGDSILTLTVIAESPLAVVSQAVDSSASAPIRHKTTSFVSGGAPAGKHRLTHRIVTAQGRTEDRSVFLKIKDR